MIAPFLFLLISAAQPETYPTHKHTRHPCSTTTTTTSSLPTNYWQGSQQSSGTKLKPWLIPFLINV